VLLVLAQDLAKASFGERDELPTSLWAASSQLLDVTVFPVGPAEKLGKNPGTRKRRKASRGAPQTMPQKARLLQKSSAASQGAVHRKVERVTDSGNSRAWHITVKSRNGGPQGKS
jgi:hypothetical protein